jgi:prepilin-type N-terminal cleavage/methylation domain-containing protein
MKRVSWLSNQRGFTLAELLVAVSVLGLVMAGVFVLQREGQEAYLLGSSRVETQQNARVALDLMTRELRSAGSITTIASSPDIRFVDQSGNTIRYCWSSSQTDCVSSGQLNYIGRKFNTDPTQCLTGGVQSLVLTYYDKSSVLYTGTDQTKVWVIKISIKTKTEESAAPGSPGDQHATMESTIKLRATLS